MGVIDFFKGVLNKKYLNQVMQLGGSSSPQWRCQKDEDYIEEAFQKIVWCYACVDKIASAVSGVKWCLYKRQTSGNIKEITLHPILDLINIKTSNEFSSREFFNLWATYLALNGKAFVVYDNAFKPREMKLTYAHLTEVFADFDGLIKIEHRNPTGYQTFAANQIIFSRFVDPLNFYAGLSPIKAMARTIDTENAGIDWNKSTLDNAGIPPGAIMLSNPSQKTIDHVKQRWLKNYAGKNNARIPLILDSEKANYINFGMNSIDMDFILQRKLTRTEICAGFGVPSQVVGDPEGQTYANYSEALQSFWQDTVIPKYLRLIQDNLTMGLCAKYDTTLYVEPDYDNVAALAENQDDITKRVTTQFEKGILTRNEAREAVGYEAVPDGDKFFNELNMSKGVQQQDMQNNPQNNNQDNVSNDVQNKSFDTKTTDIFSDEFQKKKWEIAEKQREKHINRCKKDVSEFFNVQAEKLKGLQVLNAKNCNKLVDAMTHKFKLVLFDNYTQTAFDFGSTTFKELVKIKADTNYNFELTEEQYNYLQNLAAEKITQINETTKQNIKLIFEAALINGLTMQEITTKLVDLYDGFSKSRSEMIAQTEMVSMSNYGSHEGAKQFNDRYEVGLKKIWIRTFDNRCRPTHKVAGGHKPIGLDEKFKVGSSELEYPGDPNGSPEEVIRCRCAIGYE